MMKHFRFVRDYKKVPCVRDTSYTFTLTDNTGASDVFANMRLTTCGSTWVGSAWPSGEMFHFSGGDAPLKLLLQYDRDTQEMRLITSDCGRIWERMSWPYLRSYHSDATWVKFSVEPVFEKERRRAMMMLMKHFPILHGDTILVIASFVFFTITF